MCVWWGGSGGVVGASSDAGQLLPYTIEEIANYW